MLLLKLSLLYNNVLLKTNNHLFNKHVIRELRNIYYQYCNWPYYIPLS